MSELVSERESAVRRIVGRLLARFEGIRRVYVDSPERASAEFRRIASEHLRGELRQLKLDDDAFLSQFETEVQESLVPRYARSASEMNQREESGFGFGVAASTAGRVLTTTVALLIVWVFKVRLVMVPALWPVLILSASFPFWPDIAAAVYRAHYRRTLDEFVDDLVRLLLSPSSDSEPSELSTDL